MFVGIGLKIVRDAIMLVSPDIRKDLRDLLFKSTKSFVLGFNIWLFTTLSPDFVKAPIARLFDSVSLQLETLNAQIDVAEESANKGPVSAVARIKLPRIPSEKIPDINNLYALREVVREPAIYCDPKIAQLMTELREVPPYALFFDLALIPRQDSEEFAKMCAPLGGASFSDTLAKLGAPQIIPLDSDEPIQLASPGTTPDLAPSVSPVSSLLMNPQAALQNAAEGAASSALAKSPLGQVLGSNPLEALTNPQAALQNAAEGAASSALAKSPIGQVLGSNPLTNPQAALQNATASGSNPLKTLTAPIIKK